LGEELEKPYFQELREWLQNERENYTIYPPSGQEFAALEATPYEEVKVLFGSGSVSWSKTGAWHGLFGSAPRCAAALTAKHFHRTQNDVGAAKPRDGYLMPWAKQGVLLLNAVLTVRRSEANSHKNNGWEKFTDAVIRAVSPKKNAWFSFCGALMHRKKRSSSTPQNTAF
jgi:uracil-DNA glycosylase